MILRSARENDRHAIITLLEVESLPTSDLNTQPLDHFIVAEDHSSVVGCIGAEILGESALLRSLVVARSTRQKGLAGRLVKALESQVLDQGVSDVWLLTIDANDFFFRHDYRIRSREEAPDQIRQTDEFSSLCPGSAILMHKPVGRL